MDQQILNTLNTPRERPINSFTRRNVFNADRHDQPPPPNPVPVTLPTRIRPHMQTFNWDSLSLSPVIVRPSQAEIRRATTNLFFREIENPVNLLCPITQQPFENNDTVTLINHCRHVFTRNEIAEWFGSNVRCPVCRFDIRNHNQDASNINVETQNDHESSNNIDHDNISENSSSTERRILNDLAESINTEIERLSGNDPTSENSNVSDRQFLMDPSGNLTYRFTLRPRSDENLGND